MINNRSNSGVSANACIVAVGQFSPCVTRIATWTSASSAASLSFCAASTYASFANLEARPKTLKHRYHDLLSGCIFWLAADIPGATSRRRGIIVLPSEMFTRRKIVTAAIAIAMLTLAASPLFAAEADLEPSGEAPNPGVTLEMMAQQKFGGGLSVAERKLLHAAPLRDVPWFGPSDDPDHATNDTAHAENWGGEHTMRAEMVASLLGDTNVSRFVHPSGLALAGARIAGSRDLSYATVDKPLTLIRCYVPDGINLLSAHVQDITVRRSRAGAVFGNLANIHGDASFMSD